MRVLITGGAGFIGSHLADHLLQEGYQVRIFDNLEPQVHQGKKPAYLNPNAEFIKGDVRNQTELRAALADCDAVYHLAAAVGVGQSQYQIKRYVETNIGGTANLLDVLVQQKISLAKLIVAASMSSYGEGLYHCTQCGPVKPPLRPETQLSNGQWEPVCPRCGGVLNPLPTPENAQLNCNSIYALTKKVQEEMTLIFGQTYHQPVCALRFFNVYGSRQSLSNPYTGVAAIFLSRLKNDQPPVIYEDGYQSRDFIAVSDVCRALILALKKEEADYQVFNVGTGQPLSVLSIACILAENLGKKVEPEVTQTFRRGDVRHCFADITRIKERLRWQPKVSFSEGVKELIDWAEKAAAEDHFWQAQQELTNHGLIAE